MDPPQLQPEPTPPPAQPEAVAEIVRQTPKLSARTKRSSSAEGNGQPRLATGRRREAVARVRLLPGTGQIIVNRKAYDKYFVREGLCLTVRQPLVVTHQLGKMDVFANVEGGGLVGQAGALRLGIARAILALDPSSRQVLRGAGFLTRDPRAKERKKYGQKGARKRFQWTKR